MPGVPGGTFVMGLDNQGEMDERPAHPVTVVPFVLDVTEVTNEDYFRCVRDGPCKPHNPLSSEANHFGPDTKFRTPKRPISGVSHADAQAYCQWVGKRLPTEAQWERAARGSDGRMYPWGDDKPTRDRAVFGTNNTADVGSRPAGAGPYGHLDLAGNVWEWVADHYDPYAYRRPSAARGEAGTCEQILATLAELKSRGQQGFTGSNPTPDECEYTLRGGAFNYGAWGLRASNRVHHPGRFRLVMSGFRCARDWPDGPRDEPNRCPQGGCRASNRTPADRGRP
jgi:formylglycine-generating enzyme required for sulfatase activity